MLVGRRLDDDASVEMLEGSRLARAGVSITRRLLDQEALLSPSRNGTFRSPGRMRTGALRRIGDLQPDVVLLHWLGSRMMSIQQIGQIRRPLAWVLHDTWTFCGAEHYPHGDEDRRFVEGYRHGNRVAGERGFDLNRQTWERKRRHWKSPIRLVAPSNWMAQMARRSALACDWPSVVIPNPLEVGWWGGIDRRTARTQLDIPQDVTVLVFGALGGDTDTRKGADLLYAALGRLRRDVAMRGGLGLRVITFGGRRGFRRIGEHEVESVGHLDDEGLRTLYSAADVMVVPSRMDNLPQTAVEAIACGTPVVAFRIGGLEDIVDDYLNGRLADPYSPESLAESINWVLGSEERHRGLATAAGRSAAKWDPAVIASHYGDLISEMLEGPARSR